MKSGNRFSSPTFRALCFGLLCIINGQLVDAAGCTVTTTAVNFGIYWGDFDLSSTGSIGVACTVAGTVVQQVQLSAGVGGNITFGNRNMVSATNKISYNLYTDAAHSMIWGDGSNGSFIQSNLVSGPAASAITVYGLMPANQVVVPGTYTDTVVVTVIW